jgi:hypothetical protein
LEDVAEKIIDAVETVASDIVSATSDMINEALNGDGDDEGGEEEEEEVDEHIHVDERFIYLEHIVRSFAIIHSLISLAMLIAYCHLKGNIFH